MAQILPFFFRVTLAVLHGNKHVRKIHINIYIYTQYLIRWLLCLIFFASLTGGGGAFWDPVPKKHDDFFEVWLGHQDTQCWHHCLSKSFGGQSSLDAFWGLEKLPHGNGIPPRGLWNGTLFFGGKKTIQICGYLFSRCFLRIVFLVGLSCSFMYHLAWKNLIHVWRRWRQSSWTAKANLPMVNITTIVIPKWYPYIISIDQHHEII